MHAALRSISTHRGLAAATAARPTSPIAASPATAAIACTRPISTSPALRKDPWMLPNTPEHLASTDYPLDLPPPTPIQRPNESVDTKRARLVYQSRKRGTLESDLLLSTFAKENLDKMNEQELKEYDRLLDEPDWDIYYWATGKRNPPARWANSALLDKLKTHAMNEGKVVRRMPAL
ncbi:hypothetical protein AX14_003302 [Amanita brunnescens Koide BX004]|nr:hypothetical protein AX14_003302 [Amanita brunnescens Koide BX004]